MLTLVLQLRSLELQLQQGCAVVPLAQGPSGTPTKTFHHARLQAALHPKIKEPILARPDSPTTLTASLGAAS